MARIGYGYGSEWHLLRFLGRHREHLNVAVAASTGAAAIQWLDFAFDPSEWSGDRELQGLEFIDDRQVLDAWESFWPQTGRLMHWDAIGLLSTPGGATEWLLVEAKGNIEELRSKCGAKEEGRRIIGEAFAAVQADMAVAVGAEAWLDGYYQHANRLATLRFLLASGVPTRLLYIYFCGDATPDRTCPADEEGWRPSIEEMHKHLGLTGQSEIESRAHELFIPVAGPME